jgi:hypothetical protein
MSRETASQSVQYMIRTGCYELYAYYKPGALCAAYDAPGPEWKLAINERLPCNLTEDQLTAWIHDRIVRVPFLPAE